MADVLTYLFLFALLAFGAAAAVWAARAYLTGEAPKLAFFSPRPERRLSVVEHASVDGKRRLVLIRRDGVEHLMMIGGPVDVVIETGIGEQKGRVEAVAAAPPAPPVFARPPRTFAQGQTAAPERVPERAAE